MVQKRDNIIFEIILQLIKEEKHLRKIAKELNESHTTISRKLQELSKDNIIDYKTEGRNKIYFLKENILSKKYVQQAENYKLIKILTKYPELRIISEEIIKETKEKLIILFGSYAKETAKEESDIDIYIETKNKETKIKIENINSKINVKIGTFNKESYLIQEIINNHVIIKGVEEFYDK